MVRVMNNRNDRPRNEWQTMARVLLGGYLKEDNKGLRKHHYVSADQEAECRAILATMLSEGNPPKDICELLAGLIAPDGHELAAARRLNFSHRKRGSPSDFYATSQIASTIHKSVLLGDGPDAGVQRAIELFGISREYAYRVWKAYKPFFAAIASERK